jgi:transposase
LALEGKITAHHRFMLRQWLDALEITDRKIAAPDKQIVEKARPFEATVQTWMQLPGLRRVNAFSLLAEIVLLRSSPQAQPIWPRGRPSVRATGRAPASRRDKR